MKTGKVNLLVVDVNGSRTAVMTTVHVIDGDLVQYRVADDSIIGEVKAVLEVEQGSDISRWVYAAAPNIAARKVTKVWRANFWRITESGDNEAVYG